jgi:hypothetical protein
MRSIQKISGAVLLSHGSSLLLIAAHFLISYLLPDGPSIKRTDLVISFFGPPLGLAAIALGSLLLRRSGSIRQNSIQQPSQVIKKLSAAVLLFDGCVLLLFFADALLVHNVVSTYISSYALIALLGSASVVAGSLLLWRSKSRDRFTRSQGYPFPEKPLAALSVVYGVTILLLFAHALMGDYGSWFFFFFIPLAALLSLPPIVVGGLLLLRGSQEQPMALPDYSGEPDALLSTFYRLIQQGDGRITVLRFAMESQLPHAMAKEYLDQKAKEFCAEFEINERGSVIYRFDLGYSGDDRTLGD